MYIRRRNDDFLYLNEGSHFPFIPYRRNEMSKLQIILFFVAYFICAAPFVRLMLNWDSDNTDRKNDTKCHLLMIFTLFILPAIVNIPFYYWCHRQRVLVYTGRFIYVQRAKRHDGICFRCYSRKFYLRFDSARCFMDSIQFSSGVYI